MQNIFVVFLCLIPLETLCETNDNDNEDLWKPLHLHQSHYSSSPALPLKIVYVTLPHHNETTTIDNATADINWPMPISRNTFRELVQLLIHVINVNLLCGTNVQLEYTENKTTLNSQNKNEFIAQAGFVMGNRILTWQPGYSLPYYNYFIKWNSHITGQGLRGSFAYVMATHMDIWTNLDSMASILMHEMGHLAGVEHTTRKKYTMYGHVQPIDKAFRLSSFFNHNVFERSVTVATSKGFLEPVQGHHVKCNKRNYHALLNMIDDYYATTLKPYWEKFEKQSNLTRLELFHMYDTINTPYFEREGLNGGVM